MGNCRPKFIECLNDVNEFLEGCCGCNCNCNAIRSCNCPCNCHRPHHDCCCEEENLYTPCRPHKPTTPRCDKCHDKPCCSPCCDHHEECCHCECCCPEECCCCHCDCDDCLRDCENVFVPCPDKRGHGMSHCCEPVCKPCCKPCASPCCGNSFEQMLRCMIGKKVKIAIGSKCGTICILDVQGKYLRALVVGSGKIVMINIDQISQFRELC